MGNMNRVELKAIITNVGVTPPFWNHSKGKTGTSLTYRQNLYRINDKIPAKSRRSPDNVLKRGEVEICAFLSCVVVSSFETHPKKLRPFKNHSSTYHIIAKHIDISIVVGDTKCAISIIALLLTR